MTIQNRQYYNNIRGLVEAKEKTLTVLFKTDEQMMERIYERDLKLKFRKLYKSTNYVKKGNFRGFEVTFKGEQRELEKVTKYVEKLDRNNGIYYNHQIESTKQPSMSTDESLTEEKLLLEHRKQLTHDIMDPEYWKQHMKDEHSDWVEDEDGKWVPPDAEQQQSADRIANAQKAIANFVSQSQQNTQQGTQQR